MKRTSISFLWLLAVVSMLAVVTSASAETAKQRSGKVVRIKGAARYSTGNNVWQPLKVGTVISSGMIVQTAADSYADIAFSDDAKVRAAPTYSSSASSAAGSGSGYRPTAEQDLIRIWDDTVLAFDKLTITETGADKITETELDLRSGRLFGSVKKMSAASRFEIKIPNGVAGIRGTFIYISADGIAGCITGSLLLAFSKDSGDTATQQIMAGFQFNSKTGELDPIPQSMLPAIQQWYDAQVKAGVAFTYYSGDPTIYSVSKTGNFGP